MKICLLVQEINFLSVKINFINILYIIYFFRLKEKKESYIFFHKVTNSSDKKGFLIIISLNQRWHINDRRIRRIIIFIYNTVYN